MVMVAVATATVVMVVVDGVVMLPPTETKAAKVRVKVLLTTELGRGGSAPQAVMVLRFATLGIALKVAVRHGVCGDVRHI